MLMSFVADRNAASSGSANDAKSGKTDIAIATGAITLDPQKGWGGACLYVLRQMFNELVKLDANMEVVGDLAESWVSTSESSVISTL